LSMSELARVLDVDPPNATVVVDDLESLGLVRRGPHPTDRRAKLVEATHKGEQLARRADEILGTPPAALSALSAADLEALRRILIRAGAS
jgi:DNA-binding MarR family transcriptional regulator